MMLQDAKHKKIYDALAAVLGKENISDNPSVMLAYARDWMPASTINPHPPAFVALPHTAKEVQAIIKIANRLTFPFIPVGGNLWSVNTVAVEPHTVIIDPKRMNRIIEIDEKNMFAVIEPYVTHAQLHSEANRRGLYLGAPEAGSQMSSLANHVFQAAWGVSHRLGMGYRNILSMEWIVPTGEILTTGSLCQAESGRFWGEGPGPDLRGLVRGSYGVMGGFGMVTKMAVKLHPYPGPRVFPCEGILPNQKSVMPEDKFKWYLFTYPTPQQAVDAMYEICHAELGGNCSKWPTSYLNWYWAKSGEEYWETWKSGYWQTHCKNMVAVCLWGFTSRKQVAYESRVLDDIIHETGGKRVPQEVYDRIVSTIANCWIRTTYGPRVISRSGTFMVFSILVDTMNKGLDAIRRSAAFIDQYSPPILDCDHTDWIASYEMGHLGYEEDMYPVEKTPESLAMVLEGTMKEIRRDLKRRHEYNIAPALGSLYHQEAASTFGYEKLLKGIKKSLDPHNVSCPPQPIPTDGS